MHQAGSCRSHYKHSQVPERDLHPADVKICRQEASRGYTRTNNQTAIRGCRRRYPVDAAGSISLVRHHLFLQERMQKLWDLADAETSIHN